MPNFLRTFRVRLSLRAFMVIVLIAGGFLGWKANRARTQALAVAAVRASQGSVAYDFQETGHDVLDRKPIDLRRTPPAPGWLRKVTGDEYFQEVSRVDIGTDAPRETLRAIAHLDHLVSLCLALLESKVDRTTMEQIARIPSLQCLILAQQSADDATLAGLAGASGLRRLLIVGAADVTDAGMASLARLPNLVSLEIIKAPRLTGRGLENLGPALANLEEISIQGADITDDSMACLEGCRALKRLSLGGTKLGDPGLAHLGRLDALTSLNVVSTEVTDRGLSALGGLGNLRHLALMDTRITGAGLGSLEELESLSLVGWELTDEAINAIGKLKGLKSLYLEHKRVSPGAIAALKAARPTLKVVERRGARDPRKNKNS